MRLVGGLWSVEAQTGGTGRKIRKDETAEEVKTIDSIYAIATGHDGPNHAWGGEGIGGKHLAEENTLPRNN